MTKTVGHFSIDGDVLTGPAEYMQQQGDARLASILAGTDLLYNYAIEHDLSPDRETAILVSLQTAYAAWAGLRDLLGAPDDHVERPVQHDTDDHTS